ncbi:hypothetical protein M378DRAFT_170810 [Amanita muscaria Koide BX008]|uniref:Uncharacterized protein n=1 Tax=Amanita muscaria (strain Koide BX008) TaxID=946122 RepID=A0A0C2S6B1_AMAMK|nr:hypothetical protein M378DRAFT_170810 [Amanita muscaria Koide BX008]
MAGFLQVVPHLCDVALPGGRSEDGYSDGSDEEKSRDELDHGECVDETGYSGQVEPAFISRTCVRFKQSLDQEHTMIS